MRRHLQYARYVLVHKWFVWVEGRKLGLPLWRALLHDWSKFLPSEWVAYSNYFYGEPRYHPDHGPAFRLAWLKHIHRNPHHYEYWIPSSGRTGTTPLQMPEVLVKEMLADWRSVGRTLKQNDPLAHGWYLANREAMELHPNTQYYLEKLMGLPMDLRKAL